MLNDMKNLVAQTLREHALRDLLAVAAFCTVATACYAARLANTTTDGTLILAVDLNRILCARLWVAATAIYALTTLFAGYGDPRRSYATLLLPASAEAKFAWEIGRTLVLFPAATLALWWAGDYLTLRHLVALYPPRAEPLLAADSIFARITAAEAPLRHAPAMLYALVWFHAVATVARSGLRRVAAVAIPLAAIAAAIVWGTRHYPFVHTDFAFPLPGGGWVSRVGWCSCATETVLVHLWYLLLPAAIYLWSYYRFKERTL